MSTKVLEQTGQQFEGGKGQNFSFWRFFIVYFILFVYFSLLYPTYAYPKIFLLLYYMFSSCSPGNNKTNSFWFQVKLKGKPQIQPFAISYVKERVESRPCLNYMLLISIYKFGIRLGYT